jgi:hypothetical protein
MSYAININIDSVKISNEQSESGTSSVTPQHKEINKNCGNTSTAI